MPDKNLSSIVKDEVKGMSPGELTRFRAELKRTIPQVIKDAGKKAREEENQTAKKADK